MMYIYAGYLLLRVFIHAVAPQLWLKLDSYVELTTPVSSYLSTLEGVYLFKDLHTSPYTGSVFKQSPLLLSLFSATPPDLHFIIFAIADMIAAYSLANVAKRNSYLKASPAVIASLYLFNPFTFLSTSAFSTMGLTNCLLAGSLASQRKPLFAVLLMTLAGGLSFYPLLMLPALKVFLKVRLIKFVIMCLFSLALVAGIAWIPLESFEFLINQFGSVLKFEDLTRPNIGLWWYFFIEMFDFFRTFYLYTFQLFVASMSVPLAIRFSNQPVFALFTTFGFVSMFKPYPEASDIGFMATLLFLNVDVMNAMEFKPLSFVSLVYVSVLSPVFYYLWVYMGSGNSNFYYGTNLATSIILTMILADSTSAAARNEFGKPDETALI